MAITYNNKIYTQNSYFVMYFSCMLQSAIESQNRKAKSTPSPHPIRNQKYGQKHKTEKIWTVNIVYTIVI